MMPESPKDSICVSLFCFLNKFQLTLFEYEKILLKRYIANELKEPNFVDNTQYNQIKEEVMLFGYFAGHGCSNPEQLIVLNESSLEKAFWPVQYKLNQLTKLCGAALKVFGTFDMCREKQEKPLKVMEAHFKKMGAIE